MTPVMEYKRLIAEVPPKIIHTEEENRYYLGELEALNDRWSELTPPERELYETLGVLIEDFEKKTYKIRGESDRGDQRADGGKRAQTKGPDRRVRDRQRCLGGSEGQTSVDHRPYSTPQQEI